MQQWELFSIKRPYSEFICTGYYLPCVWTIPRLRPTAARLYSWTRCDAACRRWMLLFHGPFFQSPERRSSSSLVAVVVARRSWWTGMVVSKSCCSMASCSRDLWDSTLPECSQARYILRLSWKGHALQVFPIIFPAGFWFAQQAARSCVTCVQASKATFDKVQPSPNVGPASSQSRFAPVASFVVTTRQGSLYLVLRIASVGSCDGRFVIIAYFAFSLETTGTLQTYVFH